MSRVAHPAGPRHGDVLPADHPPVAPADLNALYPGIWPRGARRSGGVLTLGGADVRDLAAEFGTPLYVCDEEDVRSRCRDYQEAFGPDGRVFYAAKAFCSRAVLRWVSSEGLGIDVCTGGELEVALSAGVPPDRSPSTATTRRSTNSPGPSRPAWATSWWTRSRRSPGSRT